MGPLASAEPSAHSPPPKATARNCTPCCDSRNDRCRSPPPIRLGGSHSVTFDVHSSGRGLAVAKRRQPLDIGHRGGRQRAEGHFGIDPQLGHARRGRHFGRGVLAKLVAKGVQLGLLDLQAGRRRMAAVTDQMLRAGRQAACRSKPGTLRAEPMPGLMPSGSKAISTTGR